MHHRGLYNFFQSINLLYNIPVLIVIAVGYLTKKIPAIAGKIGVLRIYDSVMLSAIYKTNALFILYNPFIYN